MRQINEHKGSVTGSNEHRDYIDAYVSKMETEKDNDESSFSGNKHLQSSHYALKISFSIVPQFGIKRF